MAISPLKTLCLSEWHSLQVMASFSLSGFTIVQMAAHRALFKIEHLRREARGVAGWENNDGARNWIELLVQNNAEKRAVHF